MKSLLCSIAPCAQETLGGLSSFMALGYLSLSDNDTPLECLRPLARAHILELCLGRGRSERRRIVLLLPNVWVLDEEYVTADERRFADGFDQTRRSEASNGGDHLYAWNDACWKPVADNSEDNRGGNEPRIFSHKDKPNAQRQKTSGCCLEYQDLERHGRRTREFFQNVVWKLPCRYL